jgi:hypothetical protein
MHAFPYRFKYFCSLRSATSYSHLTSCSLDKYLHDKKSPSPELHAFMIKHYSALGSRRTPAVVACRGLTRSVLYTVFYLTKSGANSQIAMMTSLSPTVRLALEIFSACRLVMENVIDPTPLFIYSCTTLPVWACSASGRRVCCLIQHTLPQANYHITRNVPFIAR